MAQMVGCTATFAALGRAEVIEALAGAWARSGVRLVDVVEDTSRLAVDLHGVGDPASVERGALAVALVAVEGIDMNAHPAAAELLGAIHRLTFAPLLDGDLEPCVEIARRTGRQVALELGLPVFLTGEAATRADRRRAEAVVAGGYAELAAAAETDARWAPDFGPRQPGAAGAVAVGAERGGLELSLAVDGPPATAMAIAAAIDERSGGLAGVVARVQRAAPGSAAAESAAAPAREPAHVVVEVRDVSRTPLHRVLELAHGEAARRGVRLGPTRLHGLVPQSALDAAAVASLRLDGLRAEQVLERVVACGEAAEAEPAVAVRRFVDSVASDAPTPGGGTAAALVGALGAALAAMVAGLTVGRPKYAPVEAAMERLRRQAAELQTALLALMTSDADAFASVMEAYRLPRGTAALADRRRQAIQHALREATEVPLATMRRALDVMHLARDAAASGNVNAVSDAGAAGYLAHAAALAASLNVAINIMGLRDLEEGDRYRRSSNELLLEARALSEEIEHLVHDRMKG